MWTFVGKVIYLLFNTLSRFVIGFLPRSKRLLILWLQSLSVVIMESKKMKSDAVPTFSPPICHQVVGSDAMIFVFWMLSFKPVFSLSSFLFVKRLFSSSSLSAIKVVSSVYLRLLTFLLAILIPACALSRLAFCMMYSGYNLNKQADNIQAWCTPFPILNQSIVPCPVLTVAFCPACRFLRRQVRWSDIPISLRICHSLWWSTQSKALAESIKQHRFLFFEIALLSMIQLYVGNLISGSSAFSKPSLYISGSSQFSYCWSLTWRIWSISCWHVKWM